MRGREPELPSGGAPEGKGGRGDETQFVVEPGGVVPSGIGPRRGEPPPVSGGRVKNLGTEPASWQVSWLPLERIPFIFSLTPLPFPYSGGLMLATNESLFVTWGACQVPPNCTAWRPPFFWCACFGGSLRPPARKDQNWSHRPLGARRTGPKGACETPAKPDLFSPSFLS